jgi:hypothetical protein
MIGAVARGTFAAFAKGFGAVGVLSGLLTTGCGSSNSPSTTPGVFQPTTPTSPVFNIAGNWSGTFRTSNLPTRTITMTIVQSSSCVDGAWKDSAGQWSGAISGFATADSFSGQFSFERTADGGGKCTAVGLAEGPIGDNGIGLKVATFSTSGSCDGELPEGTTITLQRQP